MVRVVLVFGLNLLKKWGGGGLLCIIIQMYQKGTVFTVRLAVPVLLVPKFFKLPEETDIVAF